MGPVGHAGLTSTVSLVTGGTGFVGRALVRRLLAEGDDVRVLAAPGDPLAASLTAELGDLPGLEVVTGDVTDHGSIMRHFREVHRVFHVAALVSSQDSHTAFYRVNVQGTENVCRACVEHGVGRLVAVSTSDVFGIPGDEEVFTEESPYRRWREPYPDTKIDAAKCVRRYFEEQGLATTLIYPGWVYGPGDRNFLPAVAEMLRDGTALTWGEGNRFEISLVYIDDLIDGIVAAAESPKAVGEDFLLLDEASGFTVDDFYRSVADELGYAVKTHHLPYALMYGVAWLSQRSAKWGLTKQPVIRTNDVKSFAYPFRFSTAKARDVLGWHPSTATGDGIHRAVDWYRHNVLAT